MESSSKLLKNITRLINKLIDANRRLRRENDELLSERERLTEEKISLKRIVERYRNEEKVEDITTSFVVSEGDKQKAKRQIDKILREIDVCIDKLKTKD